MGIASAALALSATACGKSSTDSGASPSSDAKVTKAAIAYDIGGRGDQSFNDAAYAGLKKAEDELGVKGAEAEPSEGEGDADKVQRLTALARAGNNPVIGVGFAYAPAIEKVAKAYPKTTFGLIDDTSKTGPNIANLVFNEEQGSYLAGRRRRQDVQDRHGRLHRRCRGSADQEVRGGLRPGRQGHQPQGEGARPVPDPAAELRRLLEARPRQGRRRGPDRQRRRRDLRRRRSRRLPARSRPPRPPTSGRSASTPTSTTRRVWPPTRTTS